MVSYLRLTVFGAFIIWLVARANDESMTWVLQEYGGEIWSAALWLIRLASGGI